MIKHVVIWKLKEFKEGYNLINDIKSLEGQIPGLLSIEAGVDINRSDSAGDLILISTHSDKAALDNYQDHPSHVIVRDKIKLYVTGRTVVDFII